MRAFFVAQPRATEFREIDQPSPGPGEVRLRVQFVGFCGSDLNTYRGLNPLVSYPRIPGHELSAIVDAVGAEVPEAFAPGRAVLAVPYTSCGDCPACRRGRPNACQRNETLGVQRDGAMAEEIVVPASKLLTSAHLPVRSMVLVEPLSVGWHAATRGRAAAGDVVAVIGCGMVGLGAIAAASAAGAFVIAIDVARDKLALAQAAGASETIDSATEALHDRLQAMTSGRGPDVMIEAVGRPETFRACVEEVTFTGRVVYVGYAKAPVEYESRLFVQKELDVLGSRNATPSDFALVLAHLEGGLFPIERVITQVLPFDEAGQGLALWDRDPAAVSKMIVEVGR